MARNANGKYLRLCQKGWSIEFLPPAVPLELLLTDLFKVCHFALFA